VDKRLLTRYFGKQCSATESKAVEEWILDPGNRAEFEHFLETEWDSHVDQHLEGNVVAIRKPAAFKWWASAAAAIAIVFGVYHYGTQAPKKVQLQVVNALPQIEQVDQKAKISMDTFHSGIHTKITVHHERKTIRNKPNPVLAQADTVNREKKPLFVKSTKLQNFMINKVAIRKLLDNIDSNKVVLLNLNVHDITFQRLAALLKDEYGVVLEACNGVGTSKTYTARFEGITLPDLLNDMSEKMVFSYAVKDNKVMICFN
jgi:hypothetical protein